MPLCDLDCRQAKGKDKAYRLYDSGGLYLDIKPTGTKVWRLKYKFLNREKLLTIGKYPNISLLQARIKQSEAKRLIENEVDPAQHKQDEKKARRFKQTQTFELVAREWHQQNLDKWCATHAKDILHRLKNNVFIFVGQKPINTLTVQDILFCLQKMGNRQAFNLSRRILQYIGQIMRYSVTTGRIERDFTSDLKDTIKKYRKTHYAAIEVDRLPELIDAMNRNDARLYKQTTLSMKLLMLTFVRTSELINAQWNEFDLENASWHIPGERMKMRKPHFVPLSKQAITILHELGDTFGRHGYILPSVVCRKKAISNNTILKGLGRLGFKKVMTGHGFRALAMSTIKEKLGYRHEVVDRQLAHLPKSIVDQAYDRATFISERKKMMQDWADFIDSLTLEKEKLVVKTNQHSYQLDCLKPSKQTLISLNFQTVTRGQIL